MAAVLTIKKQWHDTKTLHIVGTLAFTGNYATPGDALNFNVASLEGGAESAAVPFRVEINSRASGFIFGYIPGATRDVGTIRVWQAFATELANGAYPAGILGDTIDVQADFAFGG